MLRERGQRARAAPCTRGLGDVQSSAAQKDGERWKGERDERGHTAEGVAFADGAGAAFLTEGLPFAFRGYLSTCLVPEMGIGRDKFCFNKKSLRDRRAPKGGRTVGSWQCSSGMKTIGRAEAPPEAVERMRSRTPNPRQAVDKERLAKPGGSGGGRSGKKGGKAWAQGSPWQTGRGCGKKGTKFYKETGDNGATAVGQARDNAEAGVGGGLQRWHLRTEAVPRPLLGSCCFARGGPVRPGGAGLLAPLTPAANYERLGEQRERRRRPSAGSSAGLRGSSAGLQEHPRSARWAATLGGLCGQGAHLPSQN